MIRINTMCGKRDFSGDWMHFDGIQFDHVLSDDIYLKYQINNTIDLIYCSHGIAYFDRTGIVPLLAGWYLKLTPGGTLRLATPDFNILSKMYQVGVELDKLKGPLYGEMEMNGQKIYHKCTYDEKTLTQLLTDAGFINIKRYDHTKTEHPHSGNKEDQFSDCSGAVINGTLISLNLQCNKP